MTEIWLIHGINNEGNSKKLIEKNWVESINIGASGLGKLLPDRIEFKAAFYGDVLHEETMNWTAFGSSAKPMSASSNAQDFVDIRIGDFYKEYQHAAGITDQQVEKYLDYEDNLSSRSMAGGIHKRWIKALARAMEDLIPSHGKYLARYFLAQALSYLYKPGVKDKIDNLVYDQLFNNIENSKKYIIISHSLGTVIMYDLLRKTHSTFKTPLFMTLGSPLGIKIIKKRIGPPLICPTNADNWVNISDQEDFIALETELNGDTFGCDSISNISDIDNGDNDAHSIIEYLKHPKVIGEIIRLL